MSKLIRDALAAFGPLDYDNITAVAAELKENMTDEQIQ